MDLKKKVTLALRRFLQPDDIQLQDDDGISGFVVSGQFRKMSSMDRQMLIHKALHDSAAKVSAEELRNVLTIACLTPEEYEALGCAR
jgi:acid stress-induced BolA-like protein IbaG/YrbA